MWKNKTFSLLLGLFIIISDIPCFAASKEEAIAFVEEYCNNDVEHTEREGVLYLNNHPGKNVIIDMDISTDVDDSCALSAACALDSLGIISIKAVGLSTLAENDANISAVEGMLDHYQKNSVPIGICTGTFVDTSPYWNVLASHKQTDHTKASAVTLYRDILANSDKKVDIIVTGFLTNINTLLNSSPDDISSLTGQELVKQKVGQLYITGGSLPQGYDNNFFFTKEAIESIQNVNDNWPLPICYITNDSGSMVAGYELQKADASSSDPTTQSLYAYGTSTGRAAWDPFAIYVCAFGSNPIAKLRYRRIDSYIDNDGENFFTDNSNGKHYRVYRTEEDSYYENIMESLLLYNLA